MIENGSFLLRKHVGVTLMLRRFAAFDTCRVMMVDGAEYVIDEVSATASSGVFLTEGQFEITTGPAQGAFYGATAWHPNDWSTPETGFSGFTALAYGPTEWVCVSANERPVPPLARFTVDEPFILPADVGAIVVMGSIVAAGVEVMEDQYLLPAEIEREISGSGELLLVGV